MKRNVVVSIIVPIYKIKQEYLQKSLKSIVGQTYSNLEIILVDDGSPDDSGKICDQYAARDQRIIVIHQGNNGVSVARNAGLSQATGKYIAFVDPDDYLADNFIEFMVNHITESADIIACCCNVFNENFMEVEHFYKGNRIFSNNSSLNLEPGELRTNKKDLYFQLMRSRYGQPGKVYTAIGVPWGKLFRRDFIIKNNLVFDPVLTRMQDNIFNMYAFYYANEIIYRDEPLYYYRYTHISSFLKDCSGVREIFIPVLNARYECLIKTSLINDAEIKKSYLEEATAWLITILTFDVFKSKKRKFLCKKKLALEITRYPCFKNVLNEYTPDNLKYKICLFIIRNRLYHAFEVIVKIKIICSCIRSIIGKEY